MATVALDPTIPNSAPGAPYAADVTSAFKSFLATVADGSTILFPPNRVYRAEFPWKFVSRNNIIVNGNDSQVHATVKSPFSAKVNGTGTVLNCVVGGQRWTLSSNTVVTVTAPAGTHPFAALTKAGDPPHGIKPNIFAWYAKTPSIPGNNARTQDERLDVTPPIPAATDSVIHLLMPNDKAWPNGTYKIIFTSPEDHDRVNFWVEKCNGMKFQNLTVRGANTANGAFDPTFEGQHNFLIRGGNGVEIGPGTLYDAWADGVGCYFDFSYVAAKNVWVHDTEIYGGGRHGITVNGLVGGTFENNDIHDVNRHIIDVEVNGNMQKARSVDILSNRFGSAGIGVIAISTGLGTPADIGDFRIDSNTCYGTNVGSTFWLPIGTQQDSIVAGTGKRAGEISRWENFTITNNVSSPTVQYGAGSAAGIDDWANAPAEIKVQYCDNVTIKNNVVNMQAGRLMYAVWTQNCTGVVVSGNHDHTATDSFVSPHFQWRTDALRGSGSFQGGGTFTGVGHTVISSGTHGNGSFHGGGSFPGVGRGVNRGTGTFKGGGTFAATGRGVNHGTGTFHGGGVFTAKGLGKNTGTGTFKGGGKFAGVGKGRNHGTGTFKGGGSFAGTGVGLLPSGTGTFRGGGTFTGVGLGQNYGRGTFKGGGSFPAVGRTDPTGGSYKDGEWLVGGVKMRGPGWDETPWDSGPWDGEE